MSEAEELLGNEGADTLLDAVAAGDADTAAGAQPASTFGALRHLGIALGVLAAVMLVPYASPSLRTYRIWIPGEGVPIARMFSQDAPSPSSVATGGGGASSGGPTGAGAAFAANLDEEDSPPPPSEPDGPRVRIAPSELEGLVLEVEDPDGEAMRPFYEALLRTAEGEAGAITRVAHYGDSSIAGDGITSTMRRRLQRRFGDAGHGFVLIARGTMPYRHQDIRHDGSGNWRLVQLVRSGLSDGRYGYGGVQYRAGFGASARFGTDDRGSVGGAVSRYELWFLRHPRGGRVQTRVDRGEWSEINTRSEEVEPGWHTIEVPDGPHRLELRVAGGGESRLFGMVMEREGPGVTYDSLGMVGARARRMLGFDPAHFAAQHAHRQTHLIVVQFGGNDADDRRTPEQFEEDFRRVARLVREARPEAACLVMAPLDQGYRDRGGVRTMEQVPVIVAAARRAAQQEGCAFFDTFEAMGGEGAMRQWLRSTPRLAFGDLRHATPAGYRVIGNMFYKALLKGFADHLERR